MGEIKEYFCTYQASGETIETPSYVQLPNCNTLEAEALGADIKMGDESTTPRVRSYVYTDLEDLLHLPAIDYQAGRMAETLEKCKNLRSQGKNVMLNISGPVTIMTSLIDSKIVFKAMRKNPELLEQILDILRCELIRFVEHAIEVEVNIFSYADPVCGVSIIGPKNMEKIVHTFTVPFLREMEKIAAGKAQIFLCPKTGFALLGCEQIMWRDIKIAKPMRYVEAGLSIKNEAAILGQMCVKNREYIVKETIKTITWKE